MGMGLLRWLLWPRRRREDDDDEPEKGSRSRRKDAHGVYRIEVDQEVGRFHRDGPAFSFWSSSRIILILSFLLWWIQPAGPMIAGYVGGRRAGSPWKAAPSLPGPGGSRRGTEAPTLPPRFAGPVRGIPPGRRGGPGVSRGEPVHPAAPGGGRRGLGGRRRGGRGGRAHARPPSPDGPRAGPSRPPARGPPTGG